MFAALVPLAAAAQDAPQLNLEQKTLVRCSAAFALAANLQESGDRSLGEVRELRARGQEYFVRAMASLMDQTGLGREAIAALSTGLAPPFSVSGRTSSLA